jgi:hypothetical protein
MRAAEDDFDERETRDRGGSALTLYFVLGGGVGLLAFLGWLLTL